MNDNPMKDINTYKNAIVKDGLFSEQQATAIIGLVALMSDMEGFLDERIKGVHIHPKESDS